MALYWTSCVRLGLPHCVQRSVVCVFILVRYSGRMLFRFLCVTSLFCWTAHIEARLARHGPPAGPTRPAR